MKFVDVLISGSTRKLRARSLTFEPLESKLLLSTYYVATTGSNTAAGSATAPWATIQKAANTVKPGDAVYVAPGSYTLPADGISTSTSGMPGAPITFISTVKWGAKLYNPGGVQEQSVWQNSGDYVTIQGFDISGNGANQYVWAGIMNWGGSYCHFIGNYVHDIAIPNGLISGGFAGICTDAESPVAGHNIISGNLVARIGTPGGGYLWHGIYEDAPYAIISNNICVHNMSTGITDGHYSTHMQIVNNTCIANGDAGIWIGGDNVTVEDYNNIANNICAYNQGWGIYEDADPGDNGLIGYHNQYLKNCIYENVYGPIGQHQSGDLYPASGTVTGNPQFVNYRANGTGNYQLTAGSPCIGAGTSKGMPTTDFLGVIRPSGGPYDIGAYQYVTGTFLDQSIGDPSFEQPVVGAGTFKYDPTGSPWVFTGGAGISSNNSGFTSGNPPAPQGTQVAFLQGTGTITQNVINWAAGSYVLTFDAAQRGNFGLSQQNFEVLIDDVIVGTFIPSGTSYQTYSTVVFTVIAGAHTIEFKGLDSAGGDNTAFIDAVSIS